jgi:hypothetical protein
MSKVWYATWGSHEIVDVTKGMILFTGHDLGPGYQWDVTTYQLGRLASAMLKAADELEGGGPFIDAMASRSFYGFALIDERFAIGHTPCADGWEAVIAVGGRDDEHMGGCVFIYLPVEGLRLLADSITEMQGEEELA